MEDEAVILQGDNQDSAIRYNSEAIRLTSGTHDNLNLNLHQSESKKQLNGSKAVGMINNLMNDQAINNNSSNLLRSSNGASLLNNNSGVMGSLSKDD